MKQIISLLLVIALLAFLCVTNPTTEEFADWYMEQTRESLDDGASILEQVFSTFTAHLADHARCDNYRLFSVFSYNGQKTLGIGLMFFPLDSLDEQAGGLREAYAEWLDTHVK